jgi:glutathione S-transferase
MGIFEMKKLDYLAVRFRPVAKEVFNWTGSHNAPVVVHDDEPPRTGWADILTLAERLEEHPPLIPTADEPRARMYGLAHELLGETGVAASVRLLLTHASMTTDGREGWPLPVARYLGPKYGYAPERAGVAKTRAIRGLMMLAREMEASRARGCDYLLGSEPSALDVYMAAVLGVIVPLPHEACPMPAPLRLAFETLDLDVSRAVTAPLRAHRDMMYTRHLPVPLRL